MLNIILVQGCLDLISEGGAGREEAKARSRKLVQFLKFTVRIALDLTYHTWIIHRIPPCPSLPVGSWHKAHLLKTHQHF